jgi:hypothetical protein
MRRLILAAAVLLALVGLGIAAHRLDLVAVIKSMHGG